MTGDYLGDSNANRRGKVFSVRITDVDRLLLEQKAKVAGPLMPYTYDRRTGSLGAFLVWAALQWQDKAPVLPGIEGKKKAAHKVGKTGRRRGGNTKTSPASRKKAKGKRGRK